jgi:hypothetical protein
VKHLYSVSALVIEAPESERITAPKTSVRFWGGTQQIFGAVPEDLLGGAGKPEDAKRFALLFLLPQPVRPQ